MLGLSNPGNFYPGDTATSGGIFGRHNQQCRVLLTSSGWRPGMLLNILPFTGRPAAKNVSSEKAGMSSRGPQPFPGVY